MLSVVSLLAMWAAWGTGAVKSMSTGYGLATHGAWVDCGATGWSLGAAMAATVAVAVVMVVLNRTFNILRTTTIVFAGMYMVMQGAIPDTGAQFTAGMVLNFALLAVIALIYTTYHSPQSTDRVFLAFCIVSAGSLWQYSFVPYLLALFFAMGQMRCMCGRSFLAALLGIATPYWIAWGLGIVPLDGFHLPEFTNPFAVFANNPDVPVLVAVGFTLMAGFVLTVLNLVKVYSYNARSRSINGVITIMTFITQLLCVADVANVADYVPMLNCCTAFQLALYFRINTERRGYLPVLAMIVVYAAIYVWNLLA